MLKSKKVLGAVVMVLSMFTLIVSANYAKIDAGNTDEGKVEVYSSLLADQNEQESPSPADLYHSDRITKDTLDDICEESDGSADLELNDEEIFEVGENILITQDNLEQYKKFYELEGSTEAKAKELAITYAEEQSALYVEAMKQGFTVTDQEVSEYLDSLKESLETDNKELYQHALEGFDSEEDYWEFEFKVYQVDLPIQHYIESMEKKFAEENGLERGSEEFEEAWSKQFEQLKKELVEKQNFQIVEAIQ